MAAIVPGLGWALFDFLWQGLLIGWATALALGLMRGARPEARYALACAALLLCAALPLAGIAQRVLEPDAGASALPPILAKAGTPAGSALRVHVDAGQLDSWQVALETKMPLVVLIWACGAAVLALRMSLGLLWVRQRSRAGSSRGDAAWQGRVDHLAARFGVRRKVRLGLVDDLPGPVTAGWWRPIVLVPASLVSGMPPEFLEALLAHEMAHIKRLDYVVNLFQCAVEILLFYHPSVWWLSNRIRIEREQVADDLAASMLGEPRRLALALSELDKFQLTTPHLAHAAHGGNLMSRIKRLVRPDIEPLNWKLALPILGLTAACAVFYAHAAPLQAAGTGAASAAQEGAAAAPPAPPALPAHPEHAAAPAIPAPPAPPALPAYAAPPAPPALPAPPPRPPHGVSWTHGRGEPYAVVRSGQRGTSMSGNDTDWQAIEAAKASVKGEFLWFRKGGKAYVVQDAGVMAKVAQAWAPLDTLGARMDAHGKEMEAHGKVMEALGKEMEAVAGPAKPDQAQVRALDQKIQAVSRQIEAQASEIARLGRQIEGAPNDAQRAALHGQIEQMQRKMEPLHEQMQTLHQSMGTQHAQMRDAHAPMDAIGRKMEQAGKPMDALGKKMGELGKQMEKESRAADRTVRALIDDAVDKGLAMPAPRG